MILRLFSGITEIDATIDSIDYPVLGGGASRCRFSTFDNDLSINDEIIVKDVGGTTRFQGAICRRSFKKRVEGRKKYEYEAVCISYADAAATDVNVINYEDSEQDFSGNGVEFQDWKIRNQPNKHVTWPPTGSDPIIFDDQMTAVSLPPNIVEQGEVEENDLPSHAKVIVKHWREKRFPCIPAWDDVPVTVANLKNDPAFANFGRLFKIMDPADPTLPYTEKPLFNANIGGSKFAVIGGSGLIGAGPAKWEFPLTEHLSLSATINPKTGFRTLELVGGGGPDPEPPDPDYGNYCKVEMEFFAGVLLPRVEGEHGADTQLTYVRARYLEDDERVAEPLGGFNAEDKLGEFEHVEVDVSFDLDTGEFFRDLTFGGSKGLLHTTDDLGEGKWTSDLSGSYIEKDGVTKAIQVLNGALSHYEAVKYSADVTIAGINWTLNKKVSVNGHDVCLNSIEWKFGLEASQNRTTYRGVRLIDGGFSAQLAKKKRYIKEAEAKNDSNKMRNQQTTVQPAQMANTVTQQYARICWHIDTDGNDFSEGQIVKKELDGLWHAYEELIWIDLAESKLPFKTAGNDTIFAIEQIGTKVGRLIGEDTVERDLYRAIRMAKDDGRKITHFRTLNKSPLVVQLTGPFEEENRPWLDVEANGDDAETIITTTIGSNDKPNQIFGKAPAQWDLSDATATFAWWGKSEIYISIPALVTAIEPVYEISQRWHSEETFADEETTIATYKAVAPT